MAGHLAEFYRSAAASHGQALCCATRLARGRWRGASFASVLDRAESLARWLAQRDVQPGDRVLLISDHGEHWFICHAAIAIAGAVAVPRGSDVTDDDLRHLVDRSQPVLAMLHHRTLAERWVTMTGGDLPHLVLTGTDADLDTAIAGGREGPALAVAIDPDAPATIIFTSATTGVPKGVVHSHRTLLAQMDQIARAPLSIAEHDRMLSLLPVWHIFELTVSLYAFRCGASCWFTTPRHFAEDMEQVQPTFMASAPRVWETLFARIEQGVAKAHPLRRLLFRIARRCAIGFRAASRRLTGQVWEEQPPTGMAEAMARSLAALRWLLWLVPHGLFNTAVLETIRMRTGGCLRGTVSGGGALPPQVDAFFAALGVPVLEGYGMTEVPVIAVRREGEPCLGSVGRLLPDTELRLVTVDEGRVVWQGEPGGSRGQVGEIQIRGPQVCTGYWQDAATTATHQSDGWWRTGDLGVVDAQGRLAIRGRCKDTIVLSGGENVEPVPIEDRLRRSPLIHTAVVVGQDRKHLAALVQVDLEACAERLGFSGDHAAAATDPELRRAIEQEIHQLVSRDTGFKRFELVPRCAILPEPLQVGRELTNLLKVRRHVLHERWAELIASCYD